MNEYDDDRLGRYLRELPMPPLPEGLAERTSLRVTEHWRAQQEESRWIDVLLTAGALFTGIVTWVLVQWFFHLGWAFTLFTWTTAAMAAVVLAGNRHFKKGTYEPLS
jgi:hypothetical protein